MLAACLIAAFATAAVLASAASAKTPEWGKCVLASETAKKGKYNDANCTEKGGTKEYVWIKGKELAPVPFTGQSPEGAGGVLTTGFAFCVGGEYDHERVPSKKCEEGGGEDEVTPAILKVKCTSEASEGVAEGKNKISGVHVTFTGCGVGASPCTGKKGEATGEIRTTPLKGELGYIAQKNEAGEPEVGVVLTPATKNGLFAEFNCFGGTAETYVGVGSKKEGAWYEEENGGHGGYDKIISPITPVNEMTEEYTQVYTVNETGENVPAKLENKPKYQLEDYIVGPLSPPPHNSTIWQKAGEEITNINTPEEPGEIKA